MPVLPAQKNLTQVPYIDYMKGPFKLKWGNIYGEAAALVLLSLICFKYNLYCIAGCFGDAGAIAKKM